MALTVFDMRISHLSISLFFLFWATWIKDNN